MDGAIFDQMQAQDYENIFYCQEKTFGLKAIIVIHERMNAKTHQYQAASSQTSPASHAR
jgi:hypothetical protein